MFHELMPLLAQRTLLLIISRVGADEIRINVIPQRLKSTNTDQNDALLTPLSISGTPKELDEALPAQLLEFVGAHLGRALGRVRRARGWIAVVKADLLAEFLPRSG